ncbi:uncharacterized protein LOC5502491 [Nematostella vectensis]|uniref:uncharacterized protein LOC5502491 n=1 Tax=Nematostella vectensis TaxID=45351 RepID=UPI002077533B|nr:uncharacterized protein LOC5502491 [Nematostella vectensis]
MYNNCDRHQGFFAGDPNSHDCHSNRDNRHSDCPSASSANPGQSWSAAPQIGPQSSFYTRFAFGPQDARQEPAASNYQPWIPQETQRVRQDRWDLPRQHRVESLYPEFNQSNRDVPCLWENSLLNEFDVPECRNRLEGTAVDVPVEIQGWENAPESRPPRARATPPEVTDKMAILRLPSGLGLCGQGESTDAVTFPQVKIKQEPRETAEQDLSTPEPQAKIKNEFSTSGVGNVPSALGGLWGDQVQNQTFGSIDTPEPCTNNEQVIENEGQTASHVTETSHVTVSNREATPRRSARLRSRHQAPYTQDLSTKNRRRSKK